MSKRTHIVSILTICVCLLLLVSCETKTTSVTRVVEVEKSVTSEVPVEVTRIVVQTQQVEATRLVEVTPTPTPIPSGGFIVTALESDLSSLNPIFVTDDASEFVTNFLYGGMLKPDPFSGELVCHFCSSWEWVDRTITFHLRDDLMWSDGQPVTADDFVYTYAALLWGMTNESLDTLQLNLVEPIESVTKVDDRTVMVVMKENDCTDLYDLTLGWLPQHLFGPEWDANVGPISLAGPFGDGDDPNFAAIRSSELNSAPAVSSGPFQFQEWVPGDHVTLARNPTYFEGVPYLDGLIIRLIPDEAERVRMLRTGELDIVENFGPSYLTQVELMDQLEVFKVLSDSYVYLGLQLGNPAEPQPRWLEDENSGELLFNDTHGEHPILRDPLVREAITYGVDRHAIISQVEIGQGVPLYGNMLPSLGWAFNGELGAREYDPDYAAARLDEAGWVLNENTGIREKDGRPLRLNLQTNSSSSDRVQVGELARDQLAQLGFDIQFQAMEWGAFVGVLLGQEFDMVVMSWTDIENGMEDFDKLLFESSNDVPTRGYNFVSYYDPSVDELWRNATTLPGCSIADRGVLYRQIQAALFDDMPYTWLYSPLSLIGANVRVNGVEPGPWSTWYNVHQWYLAGN